MSVTPLAYPPRAFAKVWADRKKVPFVPSFSEKLNKLLGGGMRARSVYVLTGAPGSGKTTYALELGSGALLAGYPVLFVSAELDEEVLLARYVSQKLGIPWLEALDLPTGDPRVEELMPSVQHFATLGPEGAKGLAHHVSEFRRYYAGLPVLVICDYLQHLALPMVTERKQIRQAVSELSATVHGLARGLNIPFLLLSATSRAFYDEAEEGEAKNLIGSARESGNVEYDAAAVLHLRSRKTGTDESLELTIAKNRFGPSMTSLIYQIEPASGRITESLYTAQQIQLGHVCRKVWELVEKHPGKYAKASAVAKALGLKALDVKEAIDILAIGTGELKLVFGDQGVLFPGYDGPPVALT
jgi:replicative DNA helicase